MASPPVHEAASPPAHGAHQADSEPPHPALAAPLDVDQVIAEQERIFIARQPKSSQLARLAQRSLAGGVTSSWQITVPQAV